MAATDLFSISWICVVIAASLQSSNAVVCHSNVRDTKQEEDCGPNGYCFFQDVSTADNLYNRGCDHVFLCELLISSNVSQPSSYFNRTSKTLKAHFEWCAPDVPYTGINSKRNYGTFCCCNTDFCNKDEPDEPEQPFHKVQQLISGTKADYIELLKVASGLGIIETPDTNSLH